MRWITLIYFLLVPGVVGQTLARFDLHLATGRRLTEHPVTHGVTLRDGEFEGDGFLVIKGRGCANIPVQFTVCRRYKSGSVRVLRVSYLANIPSRGRVDLQLQRAKRPPKLRGRALRCEAAPDGIEVENGHLSFIVPPSPNLVIEDLRHKKSIRDHSLQFVSGERVEDGTLTIEESGPIKAVIRQQGTVAIPTTTLTMQVDRRITVWRGRYEIGIETYFESETQSGRVGALSLSCRLPRQPTMIGGEGVRIRSRRGLESFEVIQPLRGRRYWRFPMRSDMQKQAAPEKVLVLGSSAGVLSLAVREQSWVGPHVVALQHGKELSMDVVGARHYWREGVRAGGALRLSWRPVGRVVEPTPFVEPIALQDELVHTRPRELAFLQSVLDQALEADLAAKTGLSPRGLEDAGDWMWSRDTPGNLEYDTTWGLSEQGRQRKLPRLMRWGRRSARHLINRDLDRRGTHMPLAHGAYHRFGRAELGHTWLQGLIVQSTGSADPFLEDALAQIRRAFGGFVSAQHPRRILARSVGWGLLNAAALHESKPSEDVEASAQHLLNALDAADVDGWFVLSHRSIDGAGIVPTWVAAGIVGEGLWQGVRAGIVPRHWLMRHGRFVEKLALVAWDSRLGQLNSTVILGIDGADGPETSGICTGEEMLFFALGLLRAGDACGDAALEVMAKEVILAASKRLDLTNKKLRGKEVSQIAWVLPRLAECLR